LGSGRLNIIAGGGFEFPSSFQEKIIMNITSRQFLKSAGAAALALACGITAASAQAIIVERGVMPSPRVEVIPVAPGPGYNWVRGHWAWRGGWVWIPGHHIRGIVPEMPAEVVEVVPARPGPQHYWVRGHHVWEGDRWAWRRGVWMR
jgi:hypothetical protein